MNDAVMKMIETPGIYQIGLPYSRAYVLVEVDEHRQVHQLNRRLERDGILAEDGWNPFTTVTRVETN